MLFTDVQLLLYSKKKTTTTTTALVLPCFIVLLAPQNPTVVHLWEYDAH